MRNDGIKWLSSGMNEIMGRIAKKNKIKIGINLKEIRCLEKKEKPIHSLEDAKKSFLAKQKQFSENSYIEGYLEAKLAIAIKKGNLTYEDLQ